MEKLRGLFRGVGSKVALAVGGISAAGMSMAQATPIDVTNITDTLTAVGVAVATIGAAVLAVKFGARAYKWIASAG